MPKNPLSDLDEILAKSQRLTAKFNDAGTSFRYLNRGATELGEASRLLAEGNDARNSRVASDDSRSRNFFNEVNAISLKANEEPIQSSGTDLASYLAHHHDMIIMNAIQEARQTSDTFLLDMQRRWIVDDWERSRNSFFENLGHRANKWGMEGGGGMLEEKGYGVSTPMVTPGRPTRGMSMTPGADILSSARKLLGTTTSTPAAPTAGTVGRSSLPAVIPTLLTNCAKYIEKLNPAAAKKNTTEPVAYSQSLLQLMEDSLGPHFPTSPNTSLVSKESQEVHKLLSPQDMLGFRSLLSLVSTMTGELTKDTLVPAGYFSPICFPSEQIDRTILSERKQKLSFGAKQYFEKLAFEWYQKQLMDFMARQQTTPGGAVVGNLSNVSSFTWLHRLEGTSLQSFLIAYIHYECTQGRIPSSVQLISLPGHIPALSMNTSTPGSLEATGSEQRVPYWVLLYHALRIGAYELVLSILHYLIHSLSRKTAGEDALFTIVQYIYYQQLLEQQHNKSSSAFSTGTPLTTPMTHFRASNTSSFTTASSTSANASLNGGNYEMLKERVQALAKELPQAVSTVQKFYSEATANIASGGPVVDPYYLVILNIIGGIDASEIANTELQPFIFEDFVWCHLCFITMKRVVLQGLQTASSSSSSGSSANANATAGSAMKPSRTGFSYPASPFHSNTPAVGTATANTHTTNASAAVNYDGEGEWLELIYSYGGMQYFDPNYDQPYKYALLLCLCHRFGDAIMHLYAASSTAVGGGNNLEGSNKLFPVVHALLPMLHYGLILPNVPLLQNPYSSLVMAQYSMISGHHHRGSSGGGGALLAAADRHIFTQLTPANILLSFLLHPYIQSYLPEIAIDYLFTLANPAWYASLVGYSPYSLHHYTDATSSAEARHARMMITTTPPPTTSSSSSSSASKAIGPSKEALWQQSQASFMSLLVDYLVNYCGIHTAKEIRDKIVGTIEMPPLMNTTSTTSNNKALVMKSGRLQQYLTVEQVQEVYSQLLVHYFQLATSSNSSSNSKNTISSTSANNDVSSMSIAYYELAFEYCFLTGQYSLLCAHVYTQLVTYWLPLNFQELILPLLNNNKQKLVATTRIDVNTILGKQLIESQLNLRSYWQKKSEYFVQWFAQYRTILKPAQQSLVATTTTSSSSSVTAGLEYEDYLHAMTVVLQYYHIVESVYYGRNYPLAYELFATLPTYFTPVNEHELLPVWLLPVAEDVIMLYATVLVQLYHQQPGNQKISPTVMKAEFGRLLQAVSNCAYNEQLDRKEEVLQYLYVLETYLR